MKKRLLVPLFACATSSSVLFLSSVSQSVSFLKFELNWTEYFIVTVSIITNISCMAFHNDFGNWEEFSLLWVPCRERTPSKTKLIHCRHFLTFTAFLTFILSGVELLLSLFFIVIVTRLFITIYFFCWLHFLPEGKPRHPALDACRKRQRKEIAIKCRLREMHGGSHESTGNICTSPFPPPQ